jgi:hypothetical protein
MLDQLRPFFDQAGQLTQCHRARWNAPHQHAPLLHDQVRGVGFQHLCRDPQRFLAGGFGSQQDGGPGCLERAARVSADAIGRQLGIVHAHVYFGTRQVKDGRGNLGKSGEVALAVGRHAASLRTSERAFEET